MGCDLSQLRAIALRQAFPHAAVYLHPLESPQPLGQHLAIERMLKPVASTEGLVRPLVQASVLQEVVLLPERLTEGFDFGHGDVQPRRHRGGGKDVSGHTGDFQNVLRLPLEPLEPFGNQQLRGLRQVGDRTQGGPKPPLGALLFHHPLLYPVLQQVHHEQGVALGALVDARR